MVEYTYIHIPFCTKKCKYCAFTSFVNLNSIENYIEKLLFQIEKEYDNTPQKTLYFGGGTPSLLNLKQVETIIKKFKFDKNLEITFEINPEDGNYEYLKGLIDLNINRLSIGVQTFDDEILKETGRRHSTKESLLAIKNAKKAGFKNVSIDLIYGLNNQSLSDWIKTLETAKELDIEHISTYGLKIEDNTYYKKFAPKNIADEEIQAVMYEKSIEILDNFNLYEISNFAKSEKYFSKHNLNYWNLKPYNAYGISASGFKNNIRYKNTDNIKKYFENPLLKKEEIKLTNEELLEETIFLGFRKREGINTDEINETFKINFDEKYKDIIEKYTKSGHIEKTKNGYKLSIKGILISNYILCDFLC